MNRTVAEHIYDLEARRTRLSALIMKEAQISRRNDIEAELRAVESALTLFRSALETEARAVLNSRLPLCRSDPS